MTARPPKDGRKAFRGMAPDGYRIRMMEPGEVPALAGLAGRSPAGLPPAIAADLRKSDDLHGFVRHLLGHEVFVAIRRTTGEPLAFACGRAERDLYWMSGLVADPSAKAAGLEAALLRAVEERARWFFYRALGLSVGADGPVDLAMFEIRGFVRVPGEDLPEWLRSLARNGPGDELARTVMLKWL